MNKWVVRLIAIFTNAAAGSCIKFYCLSFLISYNRRWREEKQLYLVSFLYYVWGYNKNENRHFIIINKQLIRILFEGNVSSGWIGKLFNHKCDFDKFVNSLLLLILSNFCIFSFKSIQNFFIIISQSEQPTTLEIISMSSLSDILRILIYIDDLVTHCILADIDTQKQSHYFLFMQSW